MFETIKVIFQSDGLLIATCVFVSVMGCIWYLGKREDKNATIHMASSHDLNEAESTELEFEMLNSPRFEASRKRL
ncbi:MAG: hypothetical protein QNI91_18530 [Arenicellales bacterium]|nr:hypothetical protein [Arenicellales bacterium]